jgi:exodeoxyribonuclease V beta subunit
MAELPKGANTGNAMHEILEKLDLSVCSSEESEKLINQMLQKYSIDIKFNQTILENINNLKNKILDKDANLRLKNIPTSDTLHEMEFYFPAHNINLHDISSVFKQQAGGSKLESKIAESLKADPDIQSTGFMKGYIDFIFRHKNKYYIIDWKTNYLGSTTNDYSYDFMVDAICDSLYFLQYHIYIVALILHLRQHIPDLSYDKHFGGVYYIFLRGLNDNEYDQNGIFYHKPSEQTIANLMQCFKIAPIKKP